MVAVVLIGAALQRNFGFYDPIAVVLITLALAAGFAGVHAIHFPGRFDLVRILLFGVLAELLFSWIGRQGTEILLNPGLDLRPYLLGMVAVSVAVLAQAVGLFRAEVWGFPLVLAAAAGLGVWTIQSSPSPHIDVFVFQQDASAALLHGTNPYQMRFPDIYGPGSPFYGPGLTNGRETLFGFPYMPLGLLLAVSGYALVGDYRYAVLGAILVTALLIWMLGRDRQSTLSAQLLLIGPTNLFLIEQGWNEPFAAALVAGLVLAEARRLTVTPALLGLVMAVKQYLFGVPALVYLASQGWHIRRSAWQLVVAFAVAAIVSVPFILLAPRDFFNSVVGFQLGQPFRADSLNVAGLIHAVTGWETPAIVGFVVLAVALLGILRLGPRIPGGLAAVIAVSYLAFFTFGRWAFENYYWFVAAVMCMAACLAPQRLNPYVPDRHGPNALEVIQPSVRDDGVRFTAQAGFR